MFNVINLPPKLDIGKAGENKSRSIDIDITKWASAFPGASYTMVYQRADGMSYVVATSSDEHCISWKPTATDLMVGYGKLEVRAYLGEVIAKSVTVMTFVNNSLEVGVAPSSKAPDWVQDIIDAYVQISPATENKLGLVKADGTTTTVDADGTIHAIGGGGGGDVTREEFEEVKTETSQIKQSLVNKQDTLVSGQNIKTVNGTSLLGSGNIAIPKGADGYTPIKGVDYFDGKDGNDYVITSADYSAIADVVLEKLPTAESEEF